jgi:hypothetical protein
MRTIKVTTDTNTFTRRTARTYTHIVVVREYSDAYKARCRAEYSGDRAKWLEERFRGAEEWFPLSWCGRLDLAEKEARGHSAGYYAHVRIYAVADGSLVREVR